MSISTDEKVSLIQKLNETELRKAVLIPLLSKMGFVDPIEHHHSNEKGKDIVVKEFDSKFKKFKYISIIVKSSDITGSSSSSDGYFAVINQIKQSIYEPYKHIYDLDEIMIDECIIITSGTIKPTALESVFNTLKQEHIDMVIRETIDINKLIDLIDEFFSEYWEEEENNISKLKKDRNILINNFVKILTVLITDTAILNKAIHNVLSIDFEIDIDTFYKTNRFIADVGYKKITVDEVDPFYKDDIYNNWGDIPEETYKIKKSAQSLLYEMDEVIEILKEIVMENNPEKIAEKCEALEGFIDYRGYLPFNAKELISIDDYYYAVKDFQRRKEYLIELGLLELSRKISQDAKEKTKRALKEFYEKYPKTEKNFWLGYKFKIINNMSFTSEVYELIREIERIKEGTFRDTLKTEILNADEDGYHYIEYAVNYYGFWLGEEKMTIDDKAREFALRFAQNVSKVLTDN